jgi:molybdopterin/thiamine biosynthesis adenylyltransferase
MMTPKSKSENLSDEELEYYSRQIVLPHIGFNGQLKLKNAKVCVVGLGGLGSTASLQLAGMGVGHLRLVDQDVIELSNLQRQPLYSVDYIDYPKVEVVAKRLHEYNPNIEIEALTLSLNSTNAEKIVRDMDVVVDGLDHMTPRYALNRACQALKVPYVFGAAIATYGSVSTIIPGKTACLECFQGNLEDQLLQSCAVVGIQPQVPNVIASIEVSEAVRIVLGQTPNLANKLFYCDIGSLTFQGIDISEVENCPVCGSRPSHPPKPIHFETVTEICGRKGKRVFVVTPKEDLKLKMGVMLPFLEMNKFEVIVRAGLGVTFKKGSDFKASILSSGVMIVEGMKDEGEAYSFYIKIVVDGLNVPPSKIK